MNRETKIAVVLNYIHIAFGCISSVIVTPLMIRNLGSIMYGVYNLVFTTGCYLLLTEFTVGNVVVSGVAKRRQINDKKELDSFISHGFLVFFIISLLALFICGCINLSAPHILRSTFTGAMIHDFQTMFWVMSLTVSLLFLQTFVYSIIAGYHKFLYTRIILIIRIISRTAGIFILLNSGFGGLSVYVLELISTFVTLVLFAVYAILRLKIRFIWHGFNRVLFRTLIKDTGWAYSFLVLDNVYWNIANLIMGATQGAGEAGIIYIAITFFVIFIQMTNVVSGHFMPQIAEYTVKKASNSDFTGIMIQGGRLIIIFLSVVVVGFAAIGQEFLVLWVGDQFLPVYHNTLIGLLVILISQTMVLGDTVMQAKGRFGMRTVIACGGTLCCALVGTLFISFFGMPYAFMGILVSALIFRIFTNAIYYRHNGMQITSFFQSVYSRLFPLSLAVILECWLLSFWRTEGIAVLFLKACVVVALHIANLWILYLTHEEKQSALNSLPFIKFKKRG